MNLILVVILGLVSSKIDFLSGQFSLRIAQTPGPRYEPLTSDLVDPLTFTTDEMAVRGKVNRFLCQKPFPPTAGYVFFSFSIRKWIVRAPLGSSFALLSNQTLFLHFSVSWWEIDVKSAYKNQSNQTRAQTNKIFSVRVTAKRSLRRSWLRLMGNLTPMIFRLFEESIFLNNSRTCWDWL